MTPPKRQSQDQEKELEQQAMDAWILNAWDIVWKDSVPDLASLPMTGNDVDDYRIVLADWLPRKWNGTARVKLQIVTPDGIPAPRDASGWTFPTVTPWMSDRWVIKVAGTLPPPVGAVNPQDFIIYDGTSRTVIHAIIPTGWISKSNEIIINTIDDEVAWKQYQSVDNANAYIESIPAVYPRSIGISGVYWADVEAIDYGSIFGDGIGNSVLQNVSLKNATAVLNDFYNCQIGNLIMKDIWAGGWAVAISINLQQPYSIDTANVTHIQTPTMGTFWLFFNWLWYSTGTPLMAYDISAVDMQAIVRASATILANVTITWDYLLWYNFSMDWVAVGLLSIGITNNTTDDNWIKTTITPGTVEEQLMTFDSIPTSWQWMLSYLYNGNTYYSNVLQYNDNYMTIETEIRNIFTQIFTAESVDLWYNTATVPMGDYSTGFTIQLSWYPGASAELFQIYAWPVAWTYASFTGQLFGMTTNITVTADNIGIIGNIDPVFLFNWMTSVDIGINTWNANNPTNTVTLTSGDGSQIPANKQKLILAGGNESYVYNLEWGGIALWQQAYLENINLLNFVVTGTSSSLTMRWWNIQGGDFNGLWALQIIGSTINWGNYWDNATIYWGIVNLWAITCIGKTTINWATLFGGTTLSIWSYGDLSLKNTIGWQVVIEPDNVLNTYECIDLQVTNNGGIWNNYSKEISWYGSPIDQLITPLQLTNGYPQKYYDVQNQLEYRATGFNPWDWILI